MESLVSRVEALERQVAAARQRSRWRALLALAGGVLLGSLAPLWAARPGLAAPPRVQDPAPAEPAKPAPEPQEFALRDASGRMRLWMGILPGGSVGLGLYDEKGVARSELFLSNQGSARLLISDNRGVGRALLGVGDDG